MNISQSVTSNENSNADGENESQLTRVIMCNSDLPVGDPNRYRRLTKQEYIDYLDQLDTLPEEVYEEDEDENYDNYERSVIIRFPEECRELYGYSHYRIPIRYVLDYAIANDRDYGHVLKDIQEDFYSGDKSYDYDTFLGQIYGWQYSAKRRAEIRFNRGKNDNKRQKNREYADTGDLFGLVELDYFTLNHPFQSEQQAYYEHCDRNEDDRKAIDRGWTKYFRLCSVDGERAGLLARELMERENAFNKDWQALCESRWALIDKIREWHNAQQMQS